MTRKPYTGILKEPIDALGPEGMLQMVERLVALAEHYEVGPLGPNALDLALKLAMDHVPGFQFKKQGPSIRGLAGGRKPDVIKDIVILAALGRADMAGEKVSEAAQDLADKHPDWDMKPGSIRRRYLRMKTGKDEGDQHRRLRLLDTLYLIEHKKRVTE